MCFAQKSAIKPNEQKGACSHFAMAEQIIEENLSNLFLFQNFHSVYKHLTFCCIGEDLKDLDKKPGCLVLCSKLKFSDTHKVSPYKWMAIHNG